MHHSHITGIHVLLQKIKGIFVDIKLEVYGIQHVREYHRQTLRIPHQITNPHYSIVECNIVILI